MLNISENIWKIYKYEWYFEKVCRKDSENNVKLFYKTLYVLNGIYILDILVNIFS